MSTSQPSVAGESGQPTPDASARRRRGMPPAWLVWTLAAAIGVGLGVGAFVAHRASSPTARATAPPITSIATWPAGARRAPNFHLVDQHGTGFSLGDLKGRPVLVTFIDPVCRNLCPLEARILIDAVHELPAAERPRIVSVSVNPKGDTATAFSDDAQHWGLDSSWRWGIGSPTQLARVWKDYAIGVQTATATVAGVTVHEVEHTEATYLVDGTGHERALFLYPFRAGDVTGAIRKLGAA